MTTLEIILICLIPIVAICSYQLCKIRYSVNLLLEILDLMIDLVSNKISPIDALDKFEELDSKYNLPKTKSGHKYETLKNKGDYHG